LPNFVSNPKFASLSSLGCHVLVALKRLDAALSNLLC
jgi:hypothetical protein